MISHFFKFLSRIEQEFNAGAQSHIHHHMYYHMPQAGLPQPPHVHLSIGVRQPDRPHNHPLNLLTRLNRFVRVIEERGNRGATQVNKFK